MQGIPFNFRSAAAPVLRQHLALAVVVGIYLAAAIWLSSLHGAGVGEAKVGTLFRDFMFRVPQMVFFVLFWRLLYLTYVAREPDRFGVIAAEVRVLLRDRERILWGFATVGIMSCFLVGFAQFKNLIPTLNPFGWDESFMELDRLLHFGNLPHEYILPLFGGPFVLSFFTGLYNVWLFLMYMVLLIACFLRPESRVRMQYLVAFVLTWAVGGNLVATLFASVGPVYYGNLGLGEIYAPLLGHLDRHAETGFVTVRETQELLWSFYVAEDSLNGISAFPSMHVASSALMAIFAFCWTRLAGYLMSAFALIILIGSVLLAWHYAVDGYAGLVIAWLAWRVAGWVVRLPVFGATADTAR
jgi:membrane-associated phospholipid phosphatase